VLNLVKDINRVGNMFKIPGNKEKMKSEGPLSNLKKGMFLTLTLK
jgi:hypothetical protein